MSSPNRATRRRAATDQARAAQADPRFQQQMQDQQQQQAVQALVAQHDTAMAALARANRDLANQEREIARQAELIAHLERERAGILADLEQSDTDIADLIGALTGTPTAKEVAELVGRIAPDPEPDVEPIELPKPKAVKKPKAVAANGDRADDVKVDVEP